MKEARASDEDAKAAAERRAFLMRAGKIAVAAPAAALLLASSTRQVEANPCVYCK
jgi:hypothetical protein